MNVPFEAPPATSCMDNLVYVVDDDEDDRLLIREALEKIVPHVTIVEAEDGIQLLRLLEPKGQSKAPLPQLILLDMNMPRMNGMEALKQLRITPSLRGIPTVMISTSSQPEQMNEAYKLGVRAYLTKPSHFNEYEKIARSLVVSFLNVPL